VKHYISDDMLVAMTAGVEGIRSQARHLEMELATPDKEKLREMLWPQVEKMREQADMLEGFVRRAKIEREPN